MRKVIVLLIIVVSVAFGALAQEATPEATDTAQAGGLGAGLHGIQIAHFSPDGGAVDVYLNGELLLEGVEYGDVSEYLPIPAETLFDLDFVPTGESLEAAVASVSQMSAGIEGNASIFTVTGLAADQTLTVGYFLNSLATSDASRQIDLFHGIEGVQIVDVYLDGELTYEGLEYGQYVLLAPGDDTADITLTEPGSQDTVVYEASDIFSEAGTLNLVALLGAPDAVEVVISSYDLSEGTFLNEEDAEATPEATAEATNAAG